MKKYLLFILIALFTFQISYAQTIHPSDLEGKWSFGNSTIQFTKTQRFKVTFPDGEKYYGKWRLLAGKDSPYYTSGQVLKFEYEDGDENYLAVSMPSSRTLEYSPLPDANVTYTATKPLTDSEINTAGVILLGTILGAALFGGDSGNSSNKTTCSACRGSGFEYFPGCRGKCVCSRCGGKGYQ